MSYAAWVHSAEYRTLMDITTTGNFLMSLLIISVALVLPVFEGWHLGGRVGAFAGFVVGATVAFYIARKSLLRQYLHPVRVAKALAHLIKPKALAIFALFLFNTIVFFRIGMFTLIPLSILLAMYLVSVLCVWFIYRTKTNRLLVMYRKSTIVSSFISILLCLNFFFSANPQKETYYFNKKIQEDTLLEFNHDELKNYRGVRFFFYVDSGLGYPVGVEYLFEKGLLGFSVVKSYKFVKIVP